MTPRETEAWLRVSFAGLPAGRCRAALDHWGGPEALMAAARSQDPSLAQTPGCTAKAVERLYEAATRDLRQPLEALEAHGIRILTPGDGEYPPALAAIPDPPPYLFIRGRITPADEVAIAMVGTRQITEYGRGLAHRLAADFGRRGVTVISGLARGIDTAAHRGALDGGGRTIAVTACGLDIVYPSDNRDLMVEIENNGAVVSEWAPTSHPESWHFPARNRIISGLAAGVIVVEAGIKSGALITADYALEQGREVFAVPGNVHREQSKGPHNLIKQGAVLVESVDDIVTSLNARSLPFHVADAPAAKPREKAAGRPGPRAKMESVQLALEPGTDNSRPESAPGSVSPATGLGKSVTQRPDFSPQENRLWLALDVEPRHLDDVAADSGLNLAEANATLVLMELKGAAKRLPGNLFVRVVG
jgi:DNA processing protein